MKKMSEEDIAKLSKVCPVNLKPGSDRAWSLELTANTPECRDALKEIFDNLGPESKKFLTKRLVVNDPELKKIVDESE
jgi:hypothetical protein